MQIKMKLMLFFVVMVTTPVIGHSQGILLNCKTAEGREWGTLQIDIKQKTIIDKNVLQKLSAEYLEDWKEKYNQKQGKVYIPKSYDANEGATKFTITKISDQIIFGESHSLSYKSIEINRYTLQMKYPEMPPGNEFQCSKIEKGF
ncbi:MAG: hypothetical protein K9J14_04815 [Polynucleobacter sp.]|nr:hypothetical protein [Polynucleobacter sp.]